MSPATPPRILIADDQSDIIEALRLLLKGEGYQIEAAKSPAAAIKAVEARDYAMVLMDLNYARDTTSGQEGLELLARLQSLDATLPVVVMTAWASVDLAVEAMRRGARSSATRSPSARPSGPTAASSRKSSCCAARGRRPSSPPRGRCAPSSISSPGWDPRTPMC